MLDLILILNLLQLKKMIIRNPISKKENFYIHIAKAISKTKLEWYALLYLKNKGIPPFYSFGLCKSCMENIQLKGGEIP